MSRLVLAKYCRKKFPRVTCKLVILIKFFFIIKDVEDVETTNVRILINLNKSLIRTMNSSERFLKVQGPWSNVYLNF